MFVSTSVHPRAAMAVDMLREVEWGTRSRMGTVGKGTATHLTIDVKQ